MKNKMSTLELKILQSDNFLVDRFGGQSAKTVRARFFRGAATAAALVNTLVEKRLACTVLAIGAAKHFPMGASGAV